MVKPASQLNPTNTAVETIPAIKEMLRLVALMETRPSTIAPAKAIHRTVATVSGFTGRLWICRDQELRSGALSQEATHIRRHGFRDLNGKREIGLVT
jgi:hypothetical protein